MLNYFIGMFLCVFNLSTVCEQSLCAYLQAAKLTVFTCVPLLYMCLLPFSAFIPLLMCCVSVSLTVCTHFVVVARTQFFQNDHEQ